MSDMNQEAFELFATVYPHEAYAEYPDRFWAYFQTQEPGMTRETMEAMLRETGSLHMADEGKG